MPISIFRNIPLNGKPVVIWNRHILGKAGGVAFLVKTPMRTQGYEDSLHRLGQTPREHRKAAKIRAYFEELPLKPMAQFTERDLQPVLKKAERCAKSRPKAAARLLELLLGAPILPRSESIPGAAIQKVRSETQIECRV